MCNIWMNKCGTLVEHYWQRKLKYCQRSCPTVTFRTTNVTRTGVGLSQNLCGGRLMTNCQSHGIGLLLCYLFHRNQVIVWFTLITEMLFAWDTPDKYTWLTRLFNVLGSNERRKQCCSVILVDSVPKRNGEKRTGRELKWNCSRQSATWKVKTCWTELLIIHQVGFFLDERFEVVTAVLLNTPKGDVTVCCGVSSSWHFEGL